VDSSEFIDDNTIMKLCIGLVGEKGGGKDTFTSIFQEIVGSDYFIKRYKTSDLLGRTLDMWHLPRTRHNLQHLAIVMDGGFGIGTLTNALREEIKKEESDIVIFDAIRWQSDVDMVKSFPKNLIIYITADSKVRYERSKARKEKIGEGSITYEQFMDEEKVATETEISSIGKKADVTVRNEEGIDQFRAKVLEFYTQKVKGIL
jgi:dephospho-CoA kinase